MAKKQKPIVPVIKHLYAIRGETSNTFITEVVLTSNPSKAAAWFKEEHDNMFKFDPGERVKVTITPIEKSRLYEELA
jgi:hypothetical protein